MIGIAVQALQVDSNWNGNFFIKSGRQYDFLYVENSFETQNCSFIQINWLRILPRSFCVCYVLKIMIILVGCNRVILNIFFIVNIYYQNKKWEVIFNETHNSCFKIFYSIMNSKNYNKSEISYSYIAFWILRICCWTKILQ